MGLPHADFALSAHDVVQAVRARADSASTGLTRAEAEAALASTGPNEPLAVERQALIGQIVRRFSNPLIAILVLASAVSAVLGDVINAGIIFAMVALSVSIELAQTRRSQRAADALKARVSPTATVRRDGSWCEIERRLVVPGDVIRLAAGDVVPADVELSEAKDLHLQEGVITGESLPVEKSARDRLYMGTSVVSGTGTAIVTTTGPRTAFGEIAQKLSIAPLPTEFERGIARFGAFILKTVLFLVLFVFVVAAAGRRDALQSLLFAVALAVGLTPEFLPMITTVTLARGAVRMSKAKVIVKNLGSIQNFGSIDVLCSDKTGTLTRGEMVLEQHVDPLGVSSERPLLMAYVNSYFESGVENAIDAAVLTKARCNPLDSAVLTHDHPDISGFHKVDEIPFDFERRCVSVVVARDNRRLIVAKGAPESILALSTSYEAGGVVHDLTSAARTHCVKTFEALSERGYRVLGVGIAEADESATFSRSDEKNLVFLGFVAFADPPRDDAREVLGALRRAGVRVKVVTGDNEKVTAHVCERVGLSAKRMLLGSDIDRLSDPALAQRAERTDIFARVSPSQKNRILAALKRRGHVVGFLGDGINDAPSLHAADVGISVAGAVDVAKEAADIILLEPGLDALLEGILEGRRAYGNVMKYLLMGTSSNFGNMFSMAGAAALLPFLPMLPQQILLNNFLYDLSQVTIPSDTVDESYVRKPHTWNIDLIRRFMLTIGPVSSLYDFFTFYVMLKFFHASEQLFHTGWFVESLATQTLVIFVIRTIGNPFKSRPSGALTATTLAVVAFGMILPFLPMAHALGFVPLPAAYFTFLIPACATYLGFVQIAKHKLMRRAFE